MQHYHLKNANNTHFSTHFFSLAKIHMGSTKLIWDPYDLVGPMWVLTNQRKCVERCVASISLTIFHPTFVKCGWQMLTWQCQIINVGLPTLHVRGGFHSIDIDLMVALSLLIASLSYQYSVEHLNSTYM